MKNEELAAMGLTEEQAAAVMGIYGETVAAMRLEAAVDSALTAARVRDVKAARPFIDMEKLSVSGDRVSGLSEQIRQLRDRRGYLFEEEKKQKTGMRHGGEPKASRREEANAAIRSAFGKRGY